MEKDNKICNHCKSKTKIRDDEFIKNLKTRLNKMTGQLTGINKMIDEQRYCGDILIQVSAVMSALRSFGDLVLKDHLKTCVSDEIRKGNIDIIEETVQLIERLK